MNHADLIHDIPEALANRAHAGTSFVPEQRGRQERDAYAAQLVADHEALAKLATTDTKREQLAAEFSRYREGYRRRTLALLGARGACVSTMITGGSGFNVRRAQKRSTSADRRAQELIDFRARGLAAIRQALTPELAPIMAGDSDAIERLRAKLVELQAKRERMKACNAAIRKHSKAGFDALVAALIALGLSADEARVRLTPDFAGRLGFADYEIANSGAEARRLQQRIDSLTVTKAQPDQVEHGAAARLEDSPADNRVRLYFPGKPAPAVIARLKASGFRWTPSLGCWSGYRTALQAARAIAGVESSSA